MCFVEKCSDPSGKSNAYVNDNTFYHGKEVEFSCLKDYTLVPSSSKKLTCQDGDWKGTIPSCKGTIRFLSQTFMVLWPMYLNFAPIVVTVIKRVADVSFLFMF